MLEVRGLGFKPEGKAVLKSVSLTFDENRIYIITGQNGSGKSSLVRAIAGFFRQSSGSILYDGNPVDDLDVSGRANSFVACSFQNPVLFKGVSVAELLDVALANGRSTMNKAELLYHVGLDPMEYMKRQIDERLSGGELKRIEIASVLGRGMPLTILDEPEAGIDLWSFNRLTETIGKLNRENGMTFILISHQENLMQIADSIICMKSGSVDSIDDGQQFLKKLEGGHADVR